MKHLNYLCFSHYFLSTLYLQLNISMTVSLDVTINLLLDAVGKAQIVSVWAKTQELILLYFDTRAEI